VCLLNLALYRTRKTGRLRGIKLNEDLEQIGATRSTVDLFRFEWHHPLHGRVFILVYIDDLIVAGESFSCVEDIKNGVSAKLYVRDMGEVKYFIGIKVMRHKRADKLTLSNPGHIMALIQAFGMHTCAPKNTAMASGVTLNKTGENRIPDDNRYAEMVGSLLVLSKTTRPDISFSAVVLSPFMYCPEKDRMRAAKGVLRYLGGTTLLRIMYVGNDALEGYVHADWAGDTDGRRSTTGFIFPLSGGPMSWASKRQSMVATSTAEAEYVAAAMATKEERWLRRPPSDLGVDGGAVPMGDCNQSCLALDKKTRGDGADQACLHRLRHGSRLSGARGCGLLLPTQRLNAGVRAHTAAAVAGAHGIPGSRRGW